MKYSLALRDEIIEKYLNGKDTVQLEVEYGIKKTTIGYWLRTAGLTRHRGPKSKIQHEDFFDVIDTEEKAYYLGWILADGNVSVHNGQYSLKIHVGIEDKDTVDEFLKTIGSSNKTKDKGESYYVSLTSRHMVESLMKHGVIPNKSGKETMPDLQKELVPHFMRGYFDGDGITCVERKSETNRGGMRSGFISSYELLEKFQELLEEKRAIHPCQGAYYFVGSLEFSKKLYDYIYKDVTVWMKRKRNRMEIICGNTEVTG